MTQKLENILSRELQIEQEKQLFGGNIYAMAHLLPTIYITKDVKEEKEGVNNHYTFELFINYTYLVRDIIDKGGKDLSLVFAELFNLHGINIKNSCSDEDYIFKNKILIEFCAQTQMQLSLALNQSEKLLETLKSYEDNNSNIEIYGKDYCFIVIILNNLLQYYSTTINFLSNKVYFNTEFFSDMSERLNYILSNEFESIRRMFKVVECYRAIEEKPTFH